MVVSISFYATVVYQVVENKSMCALFCGNELMVCMLVMGDGEQEVLRIIGDKKELRSNLACAFDTFA